MFLSLQCRRGQTACDQQGDVVACACAERLGGEPLRDLKRVPGCSQRVADRLAADHVGEAVAAKKQGLAGCKRRVDGGVRFDGKGK